MSREHKAGIVDELEESIAKCNAGVLTNYQGLSTAELTVLRRKLRELGIQYRVVKNTLARFAARKAGKDFLIGSLDGPIAIAFGYGDEMEPAKALVNHIRSSPTSLTIKGGFLADRLLTPDEVKTLAAITSREELLAQVLAGMQGPITALLNCLTSPIREVTGILNARINQLEGK